MPLGLKLPPKLRAKLDAKAMRKFQGMQPSPEGMSDAGMGAPIMGGAGMRDAGMGAPIMGGAGRGGAGMGAPAMGGRFGVTDRGENTKDFKKGGKVKKMAKGGSTASKRGDGIATKGKTKGKFV